MMIWGALFKLSYLLMGKRGDFTSITKGFSVPDVHFEGSFLMK
jgi:hypothetical protein